MALSEGERAMFADSGIAGIQDRGNIQHEPIHGLVGMTRNRMLRIHSMDPRDLVSGTNNHYLNDQNALRDQLSRD
ncbi:hypothetical protein KBC86_01695 [Candidatus Gracilibacteria bacterium]|nr:hypothetical protein [Candidatus Gracilibacteria bacterium]